jgi:hypothetical protein
LWRRARELAMPGFHRHFVEKLMANFWTTLASGKAARIITNMQEEEGSGKQSGAEVDLDGDADESEGTPESARGDVYVSDTPSRVPRSFLGGLRSIVHLNKMITSIATKPSAKSPDKFHDTEERSAPAGMAKGVTAQGSLPTNLDGDDFPGEGLVRVAPNPSSGQETRADAGKHRVTSELAGKKDAKPAPQTTKEQVEHTRRDAPEAGKEARQPTGTVVLEPVQSQWRVNSLALDAPQDPVALGDVNAQLQIFDAPVPKKHKGDRAQKEMVLQESKQAQSSRLSKQQSRGRGTRGEESCREQGSSLQTASQRDNLGEPSAFGSYQSVATTSNQAAPATLCQRQIQSPELLEPGEIVQQAVQRLYGHSSAGPLPGPVQAVDHSPQNRTMLPSTWTGIGPRAHRAPVSFSRTAVWPIDALQAPMCMQLSEPMGEAPAYHPQLDHMHGDDAPMLAGPPLDVHWQPPIRRMASSSPPHRPLNALFQSAALPIGVNDNYSQGPEPHGNIVAWDTASTVDPHYQRGRLLHVSHFAQGPNGHRSGSATQTYRWPSQGPDGQHQYRRF